jgi:non-homologous end joining protein Ku
MVPKATWKGSIRTGEVMVSDRVVRGGLRLRGGGPYFVPFLNRNTGHRVQREYIDEQTGDPVGRGASGEGLRIIVI